MSVLEECEMILGEDVEDDSHKTEICRKAVAKIGVLAAAARKICEEAKSDGDGDPVRTLLLFCQVNSLLSGVDAVHRLLRQAIPEADEALRQLFAVKKGPYRNVNNDVETQIAYSEPVSWVVVPALKVIVHTLKDLEDLASKPK
jgi:hypothetical protein